jgi:MFS family permease
MKISSKAALYITYFTFAMVVNSGTFLIEKSISEYGIDKDTAERVLLGLHHIGIAAFALLFAPALPQWGYRRPLLSALAAVAVCSLAIPLTIELAAPSALFLVSGFCLALVRIWAYSSVSHFHPDNPHKHASMLNEMEALFTLGLVASMMLFGAFSQNIMLSWRDAYWILIVVMLVSMGLVAKASFFQTEPPRIGIRQSLRDIPANVGDIWKALSYTLVIMFVMGLILFKTTDRHILNWLQEFQTDVMRVPPMVNGEFSVLILATAAVSRLFFSALLRRINPVNILTFCLISLIIFALVFTYSGFDFYTEQTIEDLAHYPDFIWLMLAFAALWAPLLPTLISIMLVYTPANKQSTMAGIVILTLSISNLAGAYFSMQVLANFSIMVAFFLGIVPVVLLLVLSILLIKDLRSSQ